MAERAWAWRAVGPEDLPQLPALVGQALHGAPAMAELLDHVAAGRLPWTALGWVVRADAQGALSGVATTQHCLEAVLGEGCPVAELQALWAALAPDVRQAQLPEAWWPELGPLLAGAWGAEPFTIALRPAWVEVAELAQRPPGAGFGWATAEDLMALAELDEWHDRALYGAVADQPLERRLGQLAWLVGQDRVLVRRVGDRIAWQAHLSSAWPGGAEFHGFTTHPDFRGQGHAQAGLVAMAHAAQARGWPRLTSQLPASKAGLLAMHEALGFRFAEGRLLQALAQPTAH